MNFKTVLKKTGKWSGITFGAAALFVAVYAGPHFLLTPEPEGESVAVENVDDLDRYFSSLVEQQLPPAMDVTVLKKGETVFSKYNRRIRNLRSCLSLLVYDEKLYGRRDFSIN
jgi:hypothetical protein